MDRSAEIEPLATQLGGGMYSVPGEQIVRSQSPGLFVGGDELAGSRIRQEAEGIRTDVHVGNNKYIWLGTDKVFDSLCFLLSGPIAAGYGRMPTVSTPSRARLPLNAQPKRGVVSVSTRCHRRTALACSRRSSNASATDTS